MKGIVMDYGIASYLGIQDASYNAAQRNGARRNK